MNLNTTCSWVCVLQAIESCRVREILQWTRCIGNIRVCTRSIRACCTLGNICWSTLLPDGLAVIDRFDVAVAPDERILGRFEEALEDLAPIPLLLNLLGQRVTAGFELEAWFPDLPSLELDCVGDLWNEKIRVKILPVPSPVVSPPKSGGVLSKDWCCGRKREIRFFDLSLESLCNIPGVILEISRFSDVCLLDPSLLDPTYRDVFDYAIGVRETRPR